MLILVDDILVTATARYGNQCDELRSEDLGLLTPPLELTLEFEPPEPDLRMCIEGEASRPLLLDEDCIDDERLLRRRASISFLRSSLGRLVRDPVLDR